MTRPRLFAAFALALTALVFIVGPAMQAQGGTTSSTVGVSPGGRALVALTGAADKAPYWTSSSAASTYTLTQGGRAMVGVSWSAGSQVPYLSAAGTAGLLTVGTGASNLVQLDGSARLPAVDGSQLTGVTSTPVNSWPTVDYVAARDGRANGAGWTETGGTHSLVDDGSLDYHQIVATANNSAYITKAITLSNSDEWELQVEWMAAAAADGNWMIRVFDGSKRTTILGSVDGAQASPAIGAPDGVTGVNKWVTVTVRKIGDATDGMLEVWAGPILVEFGPYASMTDDATASGLLIGDSSTNTTAATNKIRSVKFNKITGGGTWNSLPSVLFKNTVRGR